MYLLWGAKIYIFADIAFSVQNWIKFILKDSQGGSYPEINPYHLGSVHKKFDAFVRSVLIL